MKQDLLLNVFPVLMLILGIFGLSSIIGTRYYKLDSAYLRIKSSRKSLSGQEVLNLCGSVFCCIIVPLLGISSDSSVIEDILSNPLAFIYFLIMILCPIGIVLVLIYILVSNLVISTKPNFIKEIILDKENNCIKVCSNVDTKIVPFKDITRFSVYSNTANVPNVKPGYVRTCGISGALISGAETVKITTDIAIIISTVNNETIKIHTIGHVLFDYSSEQLLKALKQYKTVFKNFNID